MDIRRWLTNQWDRATAVTLALIGLVALVLAMPTGLVGTAGQLFARLRGSRRP